MGKRKHGKLNFLCRYQHFTIFFIKCVGHVADEAIEIVDEVHLQAQRVGLALQRLHDEF